MRLRMTDPIYGFFGRSLVKPVVLLGATLSMLFGGLHFLNSPGDKLGSMKRSLADKICAQVVQDLPKKPGVPTLAVLNFAGDEAGYMTGLLRQKLAASGEYRVLEDRFFSKLMREFGAEETSVSRLTDAVAISRQLGVDMVLFGEVPQYEAETNAGNLKLELRMAERSSGQAVFARSYSQEIGGSLILNSYWRSRIAESSKGRRVFLWVLFTLFLPLAAIPLIRRLVAIESNMANLLLLLGLTIIDMSAALLLTGFWIPTLWTAAVLLIALAACAVYNYVVASFVEQMSH